MHLISHRASKDNFMNTSSTKNRYVNISLLLKMLSSLIFKSENFSHRKCDGAKIYQCSRFESLHVMDHLTIGREIERSKNNAINSHLLRFSI